jgi:hypothetical protein
MAFELPSDVITEETEEPAVPAVATPAAPTTFSLPGEAISRGADELADDDEFDPIGFALDNPDQEELAAEVAWKKKQKPWTRERLQKLPGIAGQAAVGIIKDFGAGVGNIAADVVTQATDETEANRDRAATQQMARAQLAENNTETFLTKMFGPNTFLGQLFEGAGSNAGVANAMMLGGSASSGGQSLLEQSMSAQKASRANIDKKKADPRSAFSEEFKNTLRLALKERELLKGNVQDTGLVGEVVGATGVKPTEVFRTGEELAQAGAPVDSEAIRTGAVTADPLNMLPMQVPKVAPALNKVTGVALKAPKAVVGAIAERIPGSIKSKALGGAATVGGGALAYDIYNDPKRALERLGVGVGVAAGLGGAKIIGHVLDNAGSKLLDPKFVSKAEREGAEAVMKMNAEGKGQLSQMTSKAANKADLERAATRVVQGVASAPGGVVPMLPSVENPEEAASMVGGAVGFGGVGGLTAYNPIKGFRPDIVQAVDTVLRDNGARKTYGTELDAKHAAWMQSAPDWVKDGINAYRGFFDGFEMADGAEPQIYVLNSADFAAEANKRRPDIPIELAKNQRGFATKDGTVLINGDYGGEATGILGHEAAGHLATENIMQVLAPELANSLKASATKGLLENGKPTAQLKKFVDAYNKEFDPTGKTKEIETSDHAISEWLAEEARSIMDGDGPAKYAAGESLREKLADNLSDYFKTKLGTKKDFSREEIPGIAGEYRNLLFEMGRFGNRARGGEDIYAGTDIPTGDQPAGEATPAGEPGATIPPRSPEQVNRTSRMQTLGIDETAADAARDSFVAEAVASEKTRRGRRPMSEKSEAEIADAAGKEFDAQLERYSGALESEGVPHPEGMDITEAIRLNELSPETNLPRWKNWGGRPAAPKDSAERVVNEPVEGEAYPYTATPEETSALTQKGWTPEEIAAMPKSQVDAEIQTAAPAAPAPAVAPAGTEGQLSTFGTAGEAVATAETGTLAAVKPETAAPATQTRPGDRPQLSDEQISDRLAQAEQAAKAAEDAKKRKTPASREKATAAAVKEARIRELLKMATETAGDEGRLQRREEYGAEKFTGRLDPDDPIHALLLDELNVHPGAENNIAILTENLGKVVFVDYRSASKEVQSEVAGDKGIDRTGKQRSKEYRKENVDARLEDADKGVDQVKAFYPLGFRVNPKTGSITATGFSPQRLLSNAAKLIEFLHSNKRDTGYKGPDDPQIASDMQGYAQNHANGYKGDGSGRLTGIEGVTVKPGYEPYTIPSNRFDLLNAAMANESAKTAKSGEAGKKAEEAQRINFRNRGFMAEGGETNKTRDFINKSGKFVIKNEAGEVRTGTKEILEPTIESLRVDPELMRAVSTEAPANENSLRATGVTDPSAISASGIPNSKAVAAGFMPGKGADKGALADFQAEAEKNNSVYQGESNGLHAFKELSTGGNFSIRDGQVTPEAIAEKAKGVLESFQAKEGDQITEGNLDQWMRDNGFLPEAEPSIKSKVEEGAFMPGTKDEPLPKYKSLWIDRSGNIRGAMREQAHADVLKGMGGKRESDLARGSLRGDTLHIEGSNLTPTQKRAIEDFAESHDIKTNFVNRSARMQGSAFMPGQLADVPVDELGFYSRLREHVERADFGKTKPKTAQHWLGVIDKWAKGASTPTLGVESRGISRDELEWSGIREWLQENGSKSLKRDDILDFIEQNGVKVEEVQKSSAEGGDSHWLDDEFQDHGDTDGDGGRLWTLEAYPNDDGGDSKPMAFISLKVPPEHQVNPLTNGKFSAWYGDEHLGDFKTKEEAQEALIEEYGEPETEGREEYEVWDGPSNSHVETFSTLEDAQRKARELASENFRELQEESGGEAGDTQFSGYKLDGGTNYKEVLLTLPIKESMDSLPEGYYLEPFTPASASQPSHYIMRNAEGRAISQGDTEQAAISNTVKYLSEGGSEKHLMRAKPFTESHWNEPNVVAHFRQQDFEGLVYEPGKMKDAAKEKVRHIDEIQSDWHQKGRERGYSGPEKAQKAKELEAKVREAEKKMREAHDAFDPIWEKIKADHYKKPGEGSDWHNIGSNARQALTDAGNATPEGKAYEAAKEEHAKLAKEHTEAYNSSLRGIPEAPFKKTWSQLAFKRALKLAIEDGADRISWSTGDQNVGHYKDALTAEVEKVTWTEPPTKDFKLVNLSTTRGGNIQLEVAADGTVTKGTGSRIAEQFEGKSLADVIGKPSASKVMEPGEGDMSGDSMEVGGAGMRTFYDEMIPQFVKGYVAKWGGKVQDVVLPNGEEVHSVKITPEMKAAVEKGQPMFMPGGPKKQLSEFKENEPSIKSKVGGEEGDSQTDFLKSGYHNGVKYDVHAFGPKTLFVNGIWASKPGEGMKFLKDLTAWADKNDVTVSGDARPMRVKGEDVPEMSREKLHRLYRMHGFTVRENDAVFRAPKSGKLMPGNEGQLSKFGEQDELGFTSTLAKVVNDKLPNRASVEQIRATLDPAKSGIKKEELEWMGLDQFLEGKKTVTKQELQEFIESNKVELKEVQKGDNPAKEKEHQEKMEGLSEEIRKLNYDITELTDGEVSVRDLRVMSDGKVSEVLQPYPEALKLWNKRLELVEQQDKAQEDWQNEVTEPKFGTWKLPGGDNYREVLLTLPQSDESKSVITKGWTAKEGDGDPASGPVWEVRDENGNWILGVPKDYAGTPEEAIRRALEKGERGEQRNSSAFRSSHWDEPNVLAHIRQQDFTDAEGSKVRVIEEIQSDWHQKGRKIGYEPKDRKAAEDAAEERFNKAQNDYTSTQPDDPRAAEVAKEFKEARDAYNGLLRAEQVPDAPFKKSWHELAFKRALRQAVEEGYDKLAWVTGEVAADRFDLSKQLDGLDVLKVANGTYRVVGKKDGNNVVDKDGLSAEDLPDTIGKELAQKAVDDIAKKGDTGAVSYRGLELKVGGEGMKGFYDKIIPDFARKYVKKWGGKVEKSKVETSNSDEPISGSMAMKELGIPESEQSEYWRNLEEDERRELIQGLRDKRDSKELHSITITPAMRESVMGGQAMFMPGADEAGADPKNKKAAKKAWLEKGTESPWFKKWFGESKVVDDEGKPLTVYSGHSNTTLYGEAYDPKKGTAGAFYATEDPNIASNYSVGKMGVKENYERGSQYRFKQANGKYGKKLYQMELTPEQVEKAREWMTDEERGIDIENYWKSNRDFDADSRRALARGGLRDLQSVFETMESLGYNVAYPKEGDDPYFMRQTKSDFEALLDHLGIDWQSHQHSQPGVQKLYLKIENPIDASKPFPPDLLAKLKEVSKRERIPADTTSTQWTRDYPLKQWVQDIEDGNEYWTTHIPKKALPIIKSFGYDGIKELGQKGQKDRAKRQINWLAFDPEQIKSAIGNQGTFDESKPSMLAMPGEPRKTWFIRDGKRVYHKRGEDGKFQSGKQSLAKMAPVGIVDNSEDDKKRQQQLANFK